MTGAEDRELLVPLKPGFDRVLSGYRPSQVRYYVEHAEAEIRLLTEDRDAALAQAGALAAELDEARRRVDGLRAEMDGLMRGPINTDGLPNRLQRMVELAQREAESIVREANARSAREWHLAERMATDLRTRYQKQLAEADRWHAEWDEQRQLVVEQAKSEADTLAETAEQQRQELDNRAEQRRLAVEADFEEAMRAKRSELAEELAALRAEAEAETRRLVQAAQASTDALTADAQTEIERQLAEADAEADFRVATANGEAERLVVAAQAEADQRLADADEVAADRLAIADAHKTATRRSRETLGEQVHSARQILSELDALLDPDAADADADVRNGSEPHGAPDTMAATRLDQDEPTGEAKADAAVGVPSPRLEAVTEAAGQH